MKRKLLSFLLLVISSATAAKEIVYLARSPRALLVGDAYTARADDEYTLFYNPAGLSKNSGVEFTPINPNLGVTNVLGEYNRFTNFPKNNPAQIADRVLGLPLYIEAGIVPTLKFGPFGLSLFADSKTSIIMRNAVHPVLDVDYRYDRGFVAGYAYTFGSGVEIKKFESGTRTALGVSVKHLNRQGFVDEFPLFGTQLLTIVNDPQNNSLPKIKSALGYSSGSGWGTDLGFMHTVKSKFNQFSFGLSVLDVGDTHFKQVSGTKPVPKQEMVVNSGVALSQDFGIFKHCFSMDLHPLNQDIDYMRRLHLGYEATILWTIKAFAGWSEGYLSYGARFKFWPFTIEAGFYDVELGNTYRQEVGKRAVISITLLDFYFDA